MRCRHFGWASGLGGAGGGGVVFGQAGALVAEAAFHFSSIYMNMLD